MYDIIFIGPSGKQFDKLKEKYPTAKLAADIKAAKLMCFTKFFWAIWPDVDIDSSFAFDYKVDDYSKDYIHVFKNRQNFDGICLIPKRAEPSNREISYRFFTNKKEVDVVASSPREYQKIYVTDYDDYINQLKTVDSEFVWIVPNDITVTFDFDYHIPYWEKDVVHVFKNGKYQDGIFLHHKDKYISKREYDYRFFTNKKEIEITASYPAQYDKIIVSNYNDYVKQLKETNSEFVWVIPDDIETDFIFDYQIPYWEKDNIHIFKNGLYNDGLFLQHKGRYISQREYEYCWHTKKKEISILASRPKPYDIVFISYNEPNANENFERLLKQFPDRTIHRVHGIEGIHQAHIEAAKVCDTVMFWVVDGDAQILDTFNFEHQVPKWQKDNVFVWRSRNPINDLEYGYGGVKLFPVKETIEMDVTKTDMTTSISTKFNAMLEVSNVTVFNTGEFETWKSAFRECCKLSSKTIRGQIDNETEERLKRWCSPESSSGRYSKWSISGARAGSRFGDDNRNKPDKLNLINDFDWLYEQFQQHTVE